MIDLAQLQALHASHGKFWYRDTRWWITSVQPCEGRCPLNNPCAGIVCLIAVDEVGHSWAGAHVDAKGTFGAAGREGEGERAWPLATHN